MLDTEVCTALLTNGVSYCAQIVFACHLRQFCLMGSGGVRTDVLRAPADGRSESDKENPRLACAPTEGGPANCLGEGAWTPRKRRKQLHRW